LTRSIHRPTVVISLPEDLAYQLDEAASEDGVSRSEVVRDAVRAFLAIRALDRVRVAALATRGVCCALFEQVLAVHAYAVDDNLRGEVRRVLRWRARSRPTCS
jgi:Arc/MetJ-type ribon-helix-helix transcriptional regulator